MKQITVKLTKVEIDHILNLIVDNEREGCYWGNKEQYWKRSLRICKKFAIDTATKESHDEA